MESFNSRLEDELMGREIFSGLAGARALVEEYLLDYKHVRPHSSLGYKMPVEVAAVCAPKAVASAPCGAPARLPHVGEEVINLTPALPLRMD